MAKIKSSLIEEIENNICMLEAEIQELQMALDDQKEELKYYKDLGEVK